MLKLRLALALSLGLAFATRAFSATEDYDKDRAVAERIVRVEFIPHYFTKDGFKIAPLQIDYLHCANLEPLLARWPTLWKGVQVALETEYEKPRLTTLRTRRGEHGGRS